MADNIEMSNFSIQDTMELGAGNQELLQGLFEPETASSNPEDVTPIIKDAQPETPSKAPEKPKGKEITPTEESDDDKTKTQAAITNFLGDGDEEEEQQEEEELSIKKDIPKSENPEEEPQETQFTALANDLYKLGVFTTEEDETPESISTPEEFLEKFNQEKKKGATEIVQNFISQFGEDYQEAFDAIFVKGVNPKDYFGTYNQVVSFSEMDLSNEDNQVSIMKRALSDQGFDPEDIETEVERLKNYGDLESVATKHHKVLVKKEATKLQEMENNAQQELQQKQVIKNQYISNVQTILQDKVKNKEFDGIPLNPKLASELQDFLLVDKWKTPTGETLTDFDRTILDLKRPENHQQKVKIGLLLKLLEKDPTLSTIQRTGITKKTDQLFGEVARQVTKSKSNSSSSTASKPNSWFL